MKRISEDRTLGDFNVQRRADQRHERGVKMHCVVVGHRQIHPEQPLWRAAGTTRSERPLYRAKPERFRDGERRESSIDNCQLDSD